MDALLGLLALADSRLPTGAHQHSAGTEALVRAGMVRNGSDLRALLVERVGTVGATVAQFAAAACLTAGDPTPAWAALDAEYDIRQGSPVLRAASRAQGRGYLRAARAAWPAGPHAVLGDAVARPHQPLAVGAVAAHVGAQPQQAAALSAYMLVTSMTSAATRLLGLDPYAVQADVAAVLPLVDEVAAAAARAAVATPDPAGLAVVGSPLADVLAQWLDLEEVRLFAS